MARAAVSGAIISPATLRLPAFIAASISICMNSSRRVRHR